MFAVLGSVLLSGCAAQNPSAGFECAPVGSGAPPSTHYAALSADQLKDVAQGGPLGLGQRDLAATRVMGERYAVGEGLPIDHAKATEWFGRAGVLPPVTSAYYVPGFGKVPGTVMTVVIDPHSRPGDPIAMAYLAQLYQTGDGVKKDVLWGSLLLSCAAQFGISQPMAPFPLGPAR
jgi:TPR repeat protein